ncbi:glycosyltransferase [Paeniroseomonas aquatica]|uniref:Glycosyltransferase n=1 Tax=Paeniroseomonas aquatica TaxID=373043 RepID=A0ABT8ADX2_9PROT|nr:glycosyltransferase [Paeniroseomonas aquatica]
MGKFPPTVGQVSTLNFWLAIGLKRLGHDVIVCSDSMSTVKDAVRAHTDESLARPPAELANIEVQYADIEDPTLYLPFANIEFTKFLSKSFAALKSFRPDVLLSHYLEPYALVGHFVAEALRIPHVITHAGTDAVRLCSDEAIAEVYREVAQKARRFVAKSRIAAERFGAALDGPRPAPYFPPSEYFQATDAPTTFRSLLTAKFGLSKDEPIFGFYGKFTRGKCLFELLTAFTEFRNAHASGKLCLVGAPLNNGLNLAEDAASCRILDHVSIHKPLPNWQIPDFIQSCTAVVYLKEAYKVAQHRSIVPREVLACGARLIATDESLLGVPEALKSSGDLLMARGPDVTRSLVTAMAIAAECKRRPRQTDELSHRQLHQDYICSWEKILLQATR